MQKYRSNIYIELLRCVACFLVLFNHTSYSIIKISPGDLSKSRIITLLLYFLCKAAVPLFLLIGGSNLLNKHDSPAQIGKRISKIIFLILGVYLLDCIVEHKNPFFPKQLYTLYNGEYNAAVWYLYLYLSILLLLPILQSIRLTNKQYTYLLAIFLAGPGLFPLLHHYFFIPYPADPIFSAFPSGYVVIFLLGNFVGNQLDIHSIRKRTLIFIWLSVIAAFGLSFLLAVYQLNTLGEIKYSTVYGTTYYTLTIIISLCVFLLARYYFSNISNLFFRNIIGRLGKYTLGIYVLGEYLRVKLEFIFSNLQDDMSDLIAVLIYTTCIFITGAILMFIFYTLKDMIFKKKIS